MIWTTVCGLLLGQPVLTVYTDVIIFPLATLET